MSRHSSTSGPGTARRPRSRLARLIALRPRRCALLAEASAELAIAAAVVKLLPFKRTLAFGATGLGKRGSGSPEELAEIVRRAADFAPLRSVCFEQGLAYQRMARRRGIDALLHYGIGFNEVASERGLHAHVWISVSGAGVLGHEESSQFREVLTSPL